MTVQPPLTRSRPHAGLTALAWWLALSLPVAAHGQGVRSLEPLLDRPAEWYASAEALEVADVVLLYQRDTGGWPKNIDMVRPPDEAERRRLAQDRREADSTIDNGATTTQIWLLARVAAAGGGGRVEAGARRGLDFLLAAEYPGGGWPQFFPLRDDYSRHVTFNDSAMVNVLRLLRAVGEGRAPFAFVDAPRRTRARAAVERGIAVILRAQIVVNGRRTAWCAQHDAVTLEPRAARTYEHPSISGSESVGIVRFLMSLDSPSPEVVAAVDAAVAWFEQVKITNLRTEARKTADGQRDVVVVTDPAASPVWARFYEIGTNRPIFSGRDGVVRYRFDEIERERRAGYSWYGDYATRLLAVEYPAWKRAHR